MASHAQVEAWWADRRCSGPHVSLTLNGRFPVRVQPELVDATLALSDAIMAGGYRSPMGATGSYNCRKIGGSNTWSLHAYAVAIDWDYGVNPYLRGTTIEPGFKSDHRFELTEWQVDAVESIVNEHGESIWRWLGWTIGDTMHFQVDVPPDRCQPTNGADVIRRGDSGTDVAKWQNYLNRWVETYNLPDVPLVEDGVYGQATSDRTLTFQLWAAVNDDGDTVNAMCVASMTLAIEKDTG